MRTFRRLLGFLAPYRRGVRWSLALAALAMVVSVAIPWLSGQAIDAIGSARRDHLRHHLAATAHDRHRLILLGLVIVGAAVVRLALTVGRRLVAGRVSLGVEYDLRDQLHRHLLSLELGFFDGQQTGQLMSRVTVDLQAVRFFLGYGLVFMVQSALTLVLAGAAMLALQPNLAAIALAPAPFVVLFAFRYGRRARPALQEVQQRIAELTANAEESIAGVRVVKAFAREAHQRARFERSVARVFDQAMTSVRLQAFWGPLIGFVPQVGLALILLIGGGEVIGHSLTLGQFTAFYLYLLMLLTPMRTLGMSLGMAQRATASGARIFQILDRAPALTAPDEAPPLPPGPGNARFEGVEATYDGASRPALQNVELDVPAGRTMALVGATGSGKTTLAALLGRLYDPTAGRVLIDGADLREIEQGSLHRAVAVVTDNPFLFSATVHDNIAYARPDATREEVVEAARRAQADGFISRLPDGYDTHIGERGLTLSGGQRQRIAIARALIAEPRVLILDDATSSVDATTERRIQAALKEFSAGRTTLVIAHRLSTIAQAEEIVVLEDGAIAARGSHDELLGLSPLYRDIVERGLPDAVFLTRKPLEPEVAGL